MRLIVDPPELRRTSDRFNQLAAEYQSVHARMTHVAATMGEAWQAADNSAFVGQINGFCEELKTMTGHLETTAQALNRQAMNYEAVCDENLAGAKRLAQTRL